MAKIAINQYSFLTGFRKSMIQVVVFFLSFVAMILASNYTDLNNTPLVDVLAKYSKELLGTLTVGGAISMAVNYFKFKSR